MDLIEVSTALSNIVTKHREQPLREEITWLSFVSYLAWIRSLTAQSYYIICMFNFGI